MPKVKLISKGFENYTGAIGHNEFKNGVSVEILSVNDAKALGCSLRVADADTDEPIGSTYDLAKNRSESTESLRQARIDQVEKANAEAEAKLEKEKQEIQSKVAETLDFDFTRESLEKVADEGGIKAVRDIANQYAVKNTSINGLIDELMALKELKDKQSETESES